jgi:acyl-CoA reductase-like NAD-dependent aldehyde dehydrogenase
MGTDIDIFYIGGEWVTPLSASRIEIRSSATGEPVGSVAEDMVHSVCQLNGAEQVLDTRNGLPNTRRHRQ